MSHSPPRRLVFAGEAIVDLLVPPESGRVLGAWAAGLPSGVLLFADPGPLVADIPAAVLDPVLARCD